MASPGGSMLRHASSSSIVIAFIATITFSCPAAEVALAGRGAPDTKRGSVADQIAPVLHRPSSRVVFTCITSALVIFSDRPCGPGAASRTLHTLEPVAASGSAVSLVPKPPSHSVRGARVAAQPDGGDDDDGDAAGTVPITCERLQVALALVDDRMRAGYSAKESARLWDRWREARSQLRD